MPISRSVRVTRTAISPRLATRTLRKVWLIFSGPVLTSRTPETKEGAEVLEPRRGRGPVPDLRLYCAAAAAKARRPRAAARRAPSAHGRGARQGHTRRARRGLSSRRVGGGRGHGGAAGAERAPLLLAQGREGGGFDRRRHVP